VRKYEKFTQKAKKTSEKVRSTAARKKRCDFKTCRVLVRTRNLPVRTTTAKSALGRTAHVRTFHLTIRTSESHASEPKRRTVWMLDTENLKLEENL
jgi:hypothetical protein